MEAMQDEDIGPAPADSVSAEDLRRALGYDRGQRNPLLTRMRKHFGERMPPVGEDELDFYRALIVLAEDEGSRQELADVITDLVRARSGKRNLTYSLLMRVSERSEEYLRKIAPLEAGNIDNAVGLYRDTLDLHRLAQSGDDVWLRTYRWVCRTGLDGHPDIDVPLLGAVRDFLFTDAGHDGDAIPSVDAHQDPLAVWHDARAELIDRFGRVDERPDAEAAGRIFELALLLLQAASVWTNTGRVDAARQRLTEALNAAADVAGEAVAYAQAALAARQWSANDAERLETLTGQLDESVGAVREVRHAYAEIEAALDAAHAEKRFLDLAELAPRAEAAKQRLQSGQTALTDLLQTLVADPDAPVSGPLAAAPGQDAAHPEPPADPCASPQPQAGTPPVGVAPALPDASSVKTSPLAMAEPLSAALTEAMKPAQSAVAQAKDPATGQSRASTAFPATLDASDRTPPLAADESAGLASSSAPADVGTDTVPAIIDAAIALSSVPPAAQNLSVDATAMRADEPAPTGTESAETAALAIEPVSVAAALWQAVADDRCGLAWQLAQAMPAASVVPPALFAALALAPCVRSADDEASVALGKNHVPAILEALGRPWDIRDIAADLLLFAAAARPTLLAPYVTDAPELLRAAPGLEQLPGFRELRATLLDTLELGETLTPTLLRGGFPQAEWNAEVRRLRGEAEVWLREAPQRQTKLQRASKLWLHWSAPSGEIGRIVATLAGESPWSVTALAGTFERYRDTDDALERLLRETDPHHGTAPIVGNLRKKLLEGVAEVCGLVGRALELLAARPSGQARLQALRERLRGQLAEAARTLVEWRAGVQADVDTAAIAHAVRRTLDDLRALLGDGNGDAVPVEPWAALHGALLLDADIRFDEDWQPPATLDPARTLALIARAPAPAAALEARCQCGDLRSARRLLDGLDPATRDGSGLEERFLALGDVQRRRARDQRDQLRTRLALALQQGAIGEADYAADSRELDAFVDGAATDLRDWGERFETIAARIDAGFERLQRILRTRLDALGEQPDRARIGRLLDADDLLTAHEYLNLCEHDEPLPEPRSEVLAFERFFPALVQAEARAQRRPQREDVLARRPLGRVALDELPEERLESAAELIDVWRELEAGHRRQPGRSGTARDPARPLHLLRRLFRTLDFIDAEVSAPTEAGTGAAKAFQMRCRPLADRAFCPVPLFGSQAQGQYAVRCLEGSGEAGVDALLAQVRGGSGAVFALVFGWLDEHRRRELAHECRQHRQTVLVIDEALIQALAGLAGNRVRALFDWTLPFTWINPFSITASRVPPELFHGRQTALQRVRNLREGFLVYGGRQLGKTALLTMTEHDCHRPTEERLALRIDLKSEGIGYGRGPSELWEVIGRRLHELDRALVDEDTARSVAFDAGKVLERRLRQWLAAKPQRQLLLMLDEADAFMLKDAEGSHPFEVLARLKQLMESTDHRFKTVFAGLRDVQRMARIARVANSPLAHLGQGICVGPLLADGESQAARRLLEAPLHALGFRFESPDLSGRILALANYYPSLIQVFGYYLIEHMIHRGGLQAGPPYLIGSRHIDDTFRQSALREEFVKRFAMTVELDPRYHLIALLIAQHERERCEAGEPRPTGVDTGWVRHAALDWWPQGFAGQQGYEDFRALLGEMVGLGVLRVASSVGTGQPGYALRSPGIVQMLGGAERIEHALEAIMDSEPPQLYEADVFHPHLGDSDSSARSPLTGRQEERLSALRHDPEQPVLALLGTVLAATPEALRRLIARYDRQHLRAPATLASPRALIEWVGEVAGTKAGVRTRAASGAEGDGFRLAVLGPEVPWAPDWIDAIAVEAQRRHLHLLFIGDEATAWRWVGAGAGERADLLRMLPWSVRAVRQWLQDSPWPVGDEERERLLVGTGGWGRLLGHIAAQMDASRRRPEVALQRALKALAEDEAAVALDWPDPAVPAVLGTLLDLYASAPIPRADAADLLATAETLDAAARTQVPAVLQWAELLGLLEPFPLAPDGPAWRSNVLLPRLLGRTV